MTTQKARDACTLEQFEEGGFRNGEREESKRASERVCCSSLNPHHAVCRNVDPTQAAVPLTTHVVISHYSPVGKALGYYGIENTILYISLFSKRTAKPVPSSLLGIMLTEWNHSGVYILGLIWT